MHISNSSAILAKCFTKCMYLLIHFSQRLNSCGMIYSVRYFSVYGWYTCHTKMVFSRYYYLHIMNASLGQTTLLCEYFASNKLISGTCTLKIDQHIDNNLTWCGVLTDTLCNIRFTIIHSFVSSPGDTREKTFNVFSMLNVKPTLISWMQL